MDTISWADATGQKPAAPAATEGTPAALTNGTIPWGVATGQSAAEEAMRAEKSSLWGKVRDKFPSVFASPEESARRWDYIKQAVPGTFAQLADMSTGLGAGLARAALFTNMTPLLMLGGMSAKDASVKVQQWQDKIPEEVSAPYLKIAKALGQEDAYHNNPLGWIMKKTGEYVEKGGSVAEERAGVPKEMVTQAVDTVFTALGVLGVKGAARSHGKYYAEKGNAAELQRAGEVNRRAATRDAAEMATDEAAINERNASLDEMTGDQKRLREIINAAKQNKAPTPDQQGMAAVTKLFEEAKAPTPADAIQASQARIAAMKRVEQQGLASQIGEVPKGRIAEPVIIGEETPAIKSAVSKLEQDGSGTLSAEERIALQKAAQQVQLVDERGNPFQKGQIDQKLLAIMGGIATGAVAAPFVFSALAHFYPERAQELRFKLEGMMERQGMPPVDPNYKAPAPTDRDFEHMHPEDRKKVMDAGDYAGPGVGGVAVAGMVLGRKGMPHPEMVTKLSQQLENRLITGQGAARDARTGLPSNPELMKQEQASLDWSRKAISRWLQKPTNELADVEIPFGERTAKLGEVMNKALKSYKHGESTKLEDVYIPGWEKIPQGEPVWKLAERHHSNSEASVMSQVGAINADALTSYLSHVGDYLRQNVDPAKLSQYDFVRAVKETAKNDARVAAEMEKAATASMKEMPVLKDYGDGMKWVELKLPEKLTPEQMKGVQKKYNSVREIFDRHIAPIHKEAFLRAWGSFDKIPEAEIIEKANSYRDGTFTPYVAIDANGKPIKNSYRQGEVAGGKTPEEAYLAGRLVEEGNALGHCVGGYCEGVAAGESRIFSLRDAKGRSHVTVEVEPQQLKAEGKLWGEFAEQRRAGGEPSFDTWVKEAHPELKNEHITQIKGKQNRAPNAEYLPYVQDLVRNPPEGRAWGEVGDLENTGLIHDGRGGFRELGADAPGYRGRERGSVDPDQLKMMAAVGTGAAVGAVLGSQLADNPSSGAFLGAMFTALGATKAGRAAVMDVGGTAENLMGLVSTRIRNISPAILRHARNFEQQVLQQTHAAIQRVDPFLVTLNQLPNEVKTGLNRALLSNDERSIRSTLAAIPGALDQWKEVRSTLTDMGQKLQGNAFLSKLREDYFPRIVTDAEGLLNTLGKELRTRLDDELLAAEKKSMRLQQRPLTDLEKSLIINKELRADAPTSGKKGFQRARGVDEVTPELEQFYAPATESLHSYIHSAVFELEKAKFFGRDLVQQKAGSVSYVDLDASVGKLLARQLKEGTITQDQMLELGTLYRSRFGPGEKGASGWIQDARNLANTGLLGNVVSAATQLSDTGMVPFHADLRGTVTAIAQKIRGKSPLSAKDYGLVDHLSEEFVSTRASAKVLNTMFKWGAFTAVDMFGKDVLLNASLDRFQRLATTEKGQAKLAKEWGGAFEGDMAQLISDLQGKKVTPLVQELLFNKLSDIQPVTKLEVPKAYLDMPNGRVMYMLKTFMLKQMDIARVKGYNEMRAGNYGEGMKNLVGYGTLLGVSGATVDMVKDWMLGRPFDPKWSDVASNALKTFGWSEFTLDMAKRGDVTKAVANIVAPPAVMLDNLIKGDPKVWNYLPIVGKLIYPRTEAGQLAEAKRQLKSDRKEDQTYQEKLEERRQLKKERLKDPRWREYYLQRARGEQTTRPSD